MLVDLLVVGVGCDEYGEGELDGEPEVTATLVPPVTREAPEPAVESGVVPDSPRPAYTPEAADTAVRVGASLVVLASYTPEPTATVVPRMMSAPVSVSAEIVEEQRKYKSEVL